MKGLWRLFLVVMFVVGFVMSATAQPPAPRSPAKWLTLKACFADVGNSQYYVDIRTQKKPYYQELLDYEEIMEIRVDMCVKVTRSDTQHSFVVKLEKGTDVVYAHRSVPIRLAGPGGEKILGIEPIFSLPKSNPNH